MKELECKEVFRKFLTLLSNSVATISQNFAKQNSGFQNWFRKIKVAKFCKTFWQFFCPMRVKITVKTIMFYKIYLYCLCHFPINLLFPNSESLFSSQYNNLKVLLLKSMVKLHVLQNCRKIKQVFFGDRSFHAYLEITSNFAK